MKDTLETSQAEALPQDKKNYATNQSVEKSISANNSNEDCITNVPEKQSRIAETAKFFNLLYGKITTPIFAYLTKFKGGTKFYSFAVADESQRETMAQTAVELADKGVDVWHSVNPVNVAPHDGKRGDENVVSYQTACVTDIDILSNAHKSKNLAANFDEAKSFLPFTPSLIIDSGHGLQAYYIFDQPILITDQNREEIKRRNNLLIEVIRQRAKCKDIDGVGDLPRILRTPGTFNYKLGSENAPLCHIVEDSGLRFSPTELDERLNALFQKQKTQPATIESTLKFNDDFTDDRDFNLFRTRRMLDFINPSSLVYDDWLAVGMALKNIGCDYSDWEQWSRPDERFKDGECERKWQGFNRDGYDVGTLFHFAQLGGYDAKETYREWYDLNKNSRPSTKKNADEEHTTQINKLKADLHDNAKALAKFDDQKNAALKLLLSIDKFDSSTVFSNEVLTAGAFAFLFDKQAYSNFKRELKLYGDKHPTEKAAVNDWIAAVKHKADEISSRQNSLLTRHNEIQAQINSWYFVSANDTLQGLTFPEGYSVTPKGGIGKIKGDSLIIVCRRPVIISGKYFDFEEKKYKVILSYMTTNGKWKHLPAVSAAIIANKSKLVDLAEFGLPVTSSNATALVDFLDAFHAINENNLPTTYTVPRCGWYNFQGKDCFVDPRRQCTMTDDEDKKISVVVDSQSQFAKSLHQVGDLAQWKKAYELAKKSPVARLMVAAAIAPSLLKILGERNFLLYIYAPTRAGKTTALYLAASAVGSDKIIRSFDATKNGLAGAAADVSDYPFLIDEKQVADKRLKEAFDSLVYALANGIGRTKLNKDSTLKKLHDWRTIAIMTGETLLLADNVTGGANTRLLTIAAPKEILSPADCKQIRNIIQEHHGLVFSLVLNKIFEVGFANLRKCYNEIVDTFSEAHPELLNDYCRYMAVMTLADGLLNSVLGNKNALADSILAAKSIFPLIPTTNEISDTARERDFVLSLIAQNQSRFIGGNVPLDRMQKISGKLDSPDYIYIVAKALQDACTDDGYNYRKLVDDLVADGFFIPADTVEKGRKAPRPCVKQRLGQMAGVWCYRIRKADL